MKKLYRLLPVAALALPFLAMAQASFNDTYIMDLVNTFKNLLDKAVPIVIAIGLVVFLWGLMQFVRKAGDEGERKKARGLMIWGVIILAVMVSVWGLVRLLQGVFLGGIDTQAAPELPQVPDVN